MPKRRRTFEEGREDLLVTASAQAKGSPVTKVIRFRNDDVPEFLKRFNEFEKRSRKARIPVS